MDDEDPQIIELAQAVSDDRPIDWAAAERSARDPAMQAVIRELSLIAKLARLSRQSVDATSSDGLLDDARDASTTVEGGIGTWAHLRLLERVGSGGFGDVYRAWDSRLGREVALKIMPATLASQDEARDFVREGGLLARVRHPHVVGVYGAETVGGTVGIWMEFVRGRTLRRIVAEDGVLGAEEAALLGITLCRATAAVHNAGLLHRDIKAHNVMREEGGRIVLMDFGLGRDIGAIAPEGTAADMAGTPLYLAPEVLLGSPPSVASDIYSLGVLLFNLVTGKYPVEGATIEEIRRAHVQGARTLLPDARPNLPPPFVAVVERAMSPDPAQRFKTCGAMEAALSSVIGADARPGTAGAGVEREPLAQPKRTRASHFTRMALSIAGVFAILAAAWMLAKSAIDRPPPPVEPAAPRFLMVLPFVNLSADPAQQYLADGVGDILTADLAGIGALRVISWHTSLRYRQTTKSLAEIGQEVKADAIIEGSVQRTGDRLRVTARLIHAVSDTLLWASTYERDAADLFALQGEIATAIAHAVRLTLTGPEQTRLANRYVTRPAAQDAYLQGRRLFYTFSTDGIRDACALFEKAVTVDPRYALAHASLARCYLALQDFGLMSPAEARQRSTRAAAAALALDDALPEAHNALAEVRFKFDWDWAGAERSYLAALALNPGSSLVRSPYSRFLSALGRTDEALQQAQLAAESEALSAEMRTSTAVILYYQRRYAEAIADYLKAIELNARFPPAHLGLGRAYAAAGKFEQAVEELNLAIDQSGGDLSYVAVLAAVHAQAGARAEAERLLARLLAEAARPSPRVAPQDLSYVYAALGDRDEAFAWLDKAFEHRSSRILWLKVDPRVDSLRSDPRFAALIRRLGLPL